jgi:NTE family protein
MFDFLRPKVGLALGGGGARGLAHIGVLKVLQREGIPIDAVAGTSMGAIVGGAFALKPDANYLAQQAVDLFQDKGLLNLNKVSIRSIPKKRRLAVKRLISFIREVYLINLEITKKWLVDGEKIRALLEMVVGEKSFSDLCLPYLAVVTDLRTGEEIWLKEGKLSDALLASSAIPGIFPPLEKEGWLLVDGGVTSLVPVDAVCSLGADLVIGVNVEGGIYREDFPHGIDILYQADDIRGHELTKLKLAKADLVIRPYLDGINWSHFSKAQLCIDRGEMATYKALPLIREKIKAKKKKLAFERIFGKRVKRGFPLSGDN